MCGCGGLLGLMAMLGSAPSNETQQEPSATVASEGASQPPTAALPTASTQRPATAVQPVAVDAAPTEAFQPAERVSGTPEIPAKAPLTNPKLRTWETADGRFSAEAEFVSMTAGVVKLKKSDGTIVAVPIEQLGDGDRRFIDDYRKSRRQ